MSIFELFAREQRELSNSEIARFIGVADSTCADLLHTLHHAGYVTRSIRSKRFYPTSRLLDNAQAITANDPLLEISRETLDTLVEKTGETALFGLLEPGFVRIIRFQEGNYALRYVMKIGEKMALHGSSLGKALLAQVSPAEAARQLRIKSLKQLTPTSVIDPVQLEEEVQRIRERGWAETRGEGVQGVGALAVGGYVGDEPVAISLTGPQERMDANREHYLRTLLEVRDAAFRPQESAKPATPKKSRKPASARAAPTP